MLFGLHSTLLVTRTNKQTTSLALREFSQVLLKNHHIGEVFWVSRTNTIRVVRSW